MDKNFIPTLKTVYTIKSRNRVIGIIGLSNLIWQIKG